MPGHHRVRKKNMIADLRMMPDDIPAPQGDIVADGRVRLHHIVFQDETVLADGRVLVHDGARMHIADEFIAFCLRSQIDLLPVPVHPCRSHRYKKSIFVR